MEASGFHREREQRRPATVIRRLRTIPTVVLGFVAVTVLLPALIVAALLVDVVRWLMSRRPFVALRLTAFLWVWLAAETIGVAILGVIWALGPRHRVDRTFRMQERWVTLLFAAVRRLFGLRLVIEGDDVIAPAPMIVMIRHASIVDNLLPTALVTRRHGIRLRFVLKHELLGDPCLDVAGSRLPNFFVDREARGARPELDGIRALATGLEPDEGLLIYPEGTRFSAAKLAAAVARLRETGRDELADRAQRLRHLLPPRLGGPLTMLAAAPGADVVFCAHHGLDGFAYLSDIWRGTLVGRELHVRFTRVARDAIPAGEPAQAAWLYDRWLELDEWVAGRAGARPLPATSAVPV